ncbi:ethylene-responsive transcription factor RAP2-12-like [Abeliophyllum distichum]|uniref:Ethylene-responsive transcription factor RAP2-12-like n=1 Tax=Abeliophyllum distichum TaxID=126358 RepID=A0ABD1PNM9_9LAMI
MQLNLFGASNSCPNNTESRPSLAATWVSNPTQNSSNLKPNNHDHIDSIRVQLHDRNNLVGTTSSMAGPGENEVLSASQKSHIHDKSSSMIINTAKMDAWPLFHASQAALDLSYPSNSIGELLTNDRKMNIVQVSRSTAWVSPLDLQHVQYENNNWFNGENVVSDPNHMYRLYSVVT